MAEREHVLADEEITGRLLAELPRWSLEEGMIRRRFTVSGWKSAVMVAGAVAHLAEAAWHHPDLLLSYGAVEVRLVTHSAGGVTDKDFALARRIEDVVGWRPGDEGGPLTGTPDDPRFAYVEPEG
jgi:4a-hydroxytetrahydrobiopterin dehydratase